MGFGVFLYIWFLSGRNPHLFGSVNCRADSVVDPDSTYHTDADLDSDFYLMRIRILIFFLSGCGFLFLFDLDADSDFYLIRIFI
jgi:hypothetical protein